MKRLALLLALLAAPARAQLIPPDRVADSQTVGAWTLHTNREAWGGVCEMMSRADTGLLLSLVTYRDDREARALRNAWFLSREAEVPADWDGAAVQLSIGATEPLEGEIAFVRGRLAGLSLFDIEDEAFLRRLAEQPAMVLRDPAGSEHRFSLDGYATGGIPWQWCVVGLTYDDPGPAPGR